MAANYRIVSEYTTNELRGGTRLAPVRVIAFETIPHTVYAEHRIDLSIIDPTQIGGIIGVLATAIEAIAVNAHVAGMEYMQDVNLAQQLSDFMLVIVTSTSGQSSETAQWLLEDLYALGFDTPERNYALTPPQLETIATVYTRLDAVEAL